MAYYFFLGTIPLPITPSSLNIETPSNNKTITLINDGEMSILKQKGLRTVSFDALLPQNMKYPFANYNVGVHYDATMFILALKGWQHLNKPFPFIVTRMTPTGKLLFCTAFLVTLEDWETEESADHGLDVVCKIKLKEYRSFKTKKIKITDDKKATISSTRDSSSSNENKFYTTRLGDTLWMISQRVYGDGEKYKELMELNKIKYPDKSFMAGVKLRVRK